MFRRASLYFLHGSPPSQSRLGVGILEKNTDTFFPRLFLSLKNKSFVRLSARKSLSHTTESIEALFDRIIICSSVCQYHGPDEGGSEVSEACLSEKNHAARIRFPKKICVPFICTYLFIYIFTQLPPLLIKN